MSFVFDLMVLAIIGYSAIVGSRRGFILIGCELASLLAATVVASLVYVPFGNWLKPVANVTYSLAYIVAFLVVWATIEVGTAALIRVTVLPHLHRQVQLSPLNQVGGAILNGLKALLIIAITLMIISSIPLPATIKKPITTP